MSRLIDNFADELFEYNVCEMEFLEVLNDMGFVDFTGIGGDFYDSSIEFYKVGNEARLSNEAQEQISKNGFLKAYLNHLDGWETHYTFREDKSVSIWRRKKNDDDSFEFVEDKQ